MIALDTNVVVRLVTRDDEEQAKRAASVFAEAEALWMSRTVWLESEWVLRYTYRLSRDVISSTFRRLLGYPTLRVESHSHVLRALDWYDAGLDFADALHLADTPEGASFASFDRKLVTRAATLQDAPPIARLS